MTPLAWLFVTVGAAAWGLMVYLMASDPGDYR